MIKSLRAGDIVSGAFLIAVGAATIAGATRIEWSTGGVLHPRTLPMLLGIALAAGGVWLMVLAFSKKYEDKPLEWPDRRGRLLWLASLGMMVLYGALMPVLGFLATSGLFVSGFIWYFGKYKIWFAAAWGLGAVIFIYALFIWLLGMEMPSGLLPS
ncbi:MAG: tripartite tricarboxylate transporter TctB family protein [Syntrophorhabdales bacterium]|jgi:putative tricarboxylic transport membrane protein